LECAEGEFGAELAAAAAAAAEAAWSATARGSGSEDDDAGASGGDGERRGVSDPSRRWRGDEREDERGWQGELSAEAIAPKEVEKLTGRSAEGREVRGKGRGEEALAGWLELAVDGGGRTLLAFYVVCLGEPAVQR
jgi:hypothetical protein